MTHKELLEEIDLIFTVGKECDDLLSMQRFTHEDDKNIFTSALASRLVKLMNEYAMKDYNAECTAMGAERTKGFVPFMEFMGEYLKPMFFEGEYPSANCPFCGEKERSLRINTEKKIFYCFKCQKGGDCITFLCLLKGITPNEAMKELWETYHHLEKHDPA